MWRHTPSGGLVGAILHGLVADWSFPFGADVPAERRTIDVGLYILLPGQVQVVRLIVVAGSPAHISPSCQPMGGSKLHLGMEAGVVALFFTSRRPWAGGSFLLIVVNGRRRWTLPR